MQKSCLIDIIYTTFSPLSLHFLFIIIKLKTNNLFLQETFYCLLCKKSHNVFTKCAKAKRCIEIVIISWFFKNLTVIGKLCSINFFSKSALISLNIFQERTCQVKKKFQ